MQDLTSETDFDTTVVAGEGLSLAYFTASWCGPCRMLKPVLEQLEAENEGLTVTRIDMDTSGELARRFQIMSIPTLIGFVNGEEVLTQIGIAPKKTLQEKFDPHL